MTDENKLGVMAEQAKILDRPKGMMPTAGTLTFNLVEYRLGLMFEDNADSGKVVGAILEFWMAPTPWFKWQLPFRTQYLEKLLADLLSLRDDILAAEAQQNGPEAEPS